MSSAAEDIVPGTEKALEQPVVEPTVEPTPEIPVAPELRYEYQPTDEQGRPMGNKQVIKYTTSDELASKLVEQNTLLIRKLRSETRKNRLGISDDTDLGDEAPRFQEAISFSQRQLTPEDTVKLTRDLLDPESFEQARDLLVESALGAKPEEVRKLLTEVSEERQAARAIAEANKFTAATPAFVKCNENYEAITNWMLRFKLAPVQANFTRAYETLKAAEVLIENVEDIPEPVVVPPPVADIAAPDLPAVEQPVIDPSMPSVNSRVPISLTRTNADGDGTPPRSTLGDDIVYEINKRRFTGLAAIEAMSADEYRRRVNTDPSFVKKEEALNKEAAARRKARH